MGAAGRRMRVRRMSRWAVFLTLLGAAALGRADVRPPNRIVQTANDRDTRVVAGNLPSAWRRQFDQGRVEASRQLVRMAIAFKPSAAQQADLDALLVAQQDPTSSRYHHWLAPDEYAARFGMSDADLAAVGAWLRSHGLVVHEASRSKNELYFSGTAAQVEAAFQTELHDYLVNGELHVANATDPSVPRAYADTVLGIRRLDDFRPRPHSRHRVVSDHFTSGITGNHFIAPNDFAAIYDLGGLYAAGFDGTGQKLAIVGQTALASHNATTDIDAFRAAANLPATKLTQILVPSTGVDTVCNGDVGEADLDIEWSGGVAPNATVVYVYVGVNSGHTCANASFSIWDALQYAISNDVAPVISTSYGACEAANGSAFAQMVRSWAKQANAQGQTITAASGDTGAADCEGNNSIESTTGLAVDLPAAIPEVSGVGGTEFDDSGGTFWAVGNDAGGGSALGYIPEIAWNDTSESVASGGGLAASGGGASTIFAKPSYQTGSGVPADGARDVPDVAFSASPDHDGYLTCSQGNCVNGFRNTDTTLGVVGGTSVGAPSFAGILTLIAQGLGATSGLGNVNTSLYAIAASAPAAFHDITTGDNIVPCQKGSPDCPAHAPFQLGFATTAGYDQVTGLGSVDASVLADHFATKVATTTTVAPGSASFPVGTNETFTATVAPGAGGSGSPAGGKVQFSIDGAQTGSPALVALDHGAYHATLSSSTLAAGAHSVTASYGGNLACLASASSPAAFSVSDFTISANPASATVNAGDSAPSTITVTAVDGFTGTVTFTCTPSSPGDEIGCNFSPPSITLTSGSPAQTTTVTITTTAAHAASANAGWLGGELLAALLLFGMPLPRRERRASLALVLALFATSGLSCGGGGGGGGGSSATAAVLPAAPTGLVATPGELSVMLAWTDTATHVSHYDVSRATAGAGPFTKIASPTAPSFTDTGLTGGTTYFYVVDAVNGGAKSAESAPVSATPSNPGTPSGHYTVTVTGTSGATSHGTAIALTVN